MQTKLKTLKDIEFQVQYTEDDNDIRDDLRQEAINDLINIYELEKILNIKLNDKTCGILTKYIM